MDGKILKIIIMKLEPPNVCKDKEEILSKVQATV